MNLPGDQTRSLRGESPTTYLLFRTEKNQKIVGKQHLDSGIDMVGELKYLEGNTPQIDHQSDYNKI